LRRLAPAMSTCGRARGQCVAIRRSTATGVLGGRASLRRPFLSRQRRLCCIY
jgi:hypothetical protein